MVTVIRPTTNALAGPSRQTIKNQIQPPRRALTLIPQYGPDPSSSRVKPRQRSASTSSKETDWLSWLKKAAVLGGIGGGTGDGGSKALLFAGLGSYPHTPHSPTAASLQVWEQASEALLEPDMTIGYETKGMEEFAGGLRGGKSVRAWLRGWVEGRTLSELMRRPDVTAAFILSSSVAILASAQEMSGSATLLPPGTSHLVGHGFIGSISALVAAGRLDLQTGVRLARLYATLPPNPPKQSKRFQTVVLSARHFHSLSSPSMFVPFEDPLVNPEDHEMPKGREGDRSGRKRAMQYILDEIHSLQKVWEMEANDEFAAAATINSSKVLIVTGTEFAVHTIIERLQDLNLANPVMDVVMPCPYHTKLMGHANRQLKGVLDRCYFRSTPTEISPVIWDPLTTYPMGDPTSSLLPFLTAQLRWHKTLSRLYKPAKPPIDTFLTIGKGAKGLGTMLRGELRKRDEGAPRIDIEEFGVKKEETSSGTIRPRPTRPTKPTQITFDKRVAN